MNSSIHFILLFATVVFFGCSPSVPTTRARQADPPIIEEIIATYTNFNPITKADFYVSPMTGIRCSSASKEEVEAARVQHGPHANASIRVYMNQLAANTFGKDAKPFPIGSVIVKQKYLFGYYSETENSAPDRNNGVGGMVKRAPGYDPENGDWEYFYFESGRKLENGRISSCVQCHKAAKATDYVYGTWR